MTDRYAVVLNVQKRDDDCQYREEKIQAAIKELDRVNKVIQKGHLVDRDKIIARVSLILNRHKVKRYIRWGIPEGGGKLLKYIRNEKEITKDALYDGVYVLRTNREDITSEEIVNAYKQLTAVEMAFRCLKDTLEIRPVYHWKEERVKAHIYICVISYLIHTAMEYLLKKNGMQLGADIFLKRINRVKLITLTDKDDKVISHKVTKKIDDETKAGLKVFRINSIKAERMYWRK
jgi:transposase